MEMKLRKMPCPLLTNGICQVFLPGPLELNNCTLPDGRQVHYNGVITTLDVLSVGTPVVSLPSPHLLGRHTYSILARLAASGADGIEEHLMVGGLKEEVQLSGQAAKGEVRPFAAQRSLCMWRLLLGRSRLLLNKNQTTTLLNGTLIPFSSDLENV